MDKVMDSPSEAKPRVSQHFHVLCLVMFERNLWGFVSICFESFEVPKG